ncbi:hypothetical protein LI90_4045 [Carbonactinospora thermoautotrophica]|uniref:Outer membrane channel protein CpnT-like N-terminal domain-containing protein n=2 Tax=Carbonactinospora thermoautotrophica TaxID=1469144 RepID=A0A132MZ41_9ACTN|nr:hypothetical protein LI90_4045 [Carbonactinospora thermoautotrophica]
MLPGELVTVLDLLGFTWPQADEDKLEDCARAWRDFANEVEHVFADADRVARAVVAENHGASIAAFEDYWPRLGGGSGQLCEAADAARLVAEVLEGFADAVRVAKGLVLAQLGLAAASLAAGPLSAVAQQGFRLAIRKALDELLERVVKSLLPRLKSEVSEVFERILREPRKHLDDFATRLRASLQGMGGPPLALAGADNVPAGVLARQLDDLTHLQGGPGGPNLMAMLSGKGGGAKLEPVRIKIWYEEGWSKHEFRRKANALKRLGDEGKLFKAPNPVARDRRVTDQYRSDVIGRIRRQFKDRNPEFMNRLINRVTEKMSPDHVWELQLGGPDTADNLRFLSRDINEGIGLRQIRPQIRGLPDGTPIKIDVIGP